MKKHEMKATLQALDGLPLPGENAALRRARAYAKAGITSLDPPSYPLPKPRPLILRRPAMALAIVLAFLGVGLGSVLGADLYTYSKASDFFAQHGLSTEGLERDELWAVYKDISRGHFSLPATGEMLQSNMGLTPSGSLSPGEVESLWEGWKENLTDADGIPLEMIYHIRTTHLDHESGLDHVRIVPYGATFLTPDPVAEEALQDHILDSSGSPVIEPSSPGERYGYTQGDDGIFQFSQYHTEQPTWTVPLNGLDGYIQFASDGRYVAVAGNTEGEAPDEAPDIILYLLSRDGDILWSYTLDNGKTQELPQYILFGEDTITLFSWTDRVHICRSVLDLSGNLLENSVSTLEQGPIYTIRQVIPFRDGHLILMRNTQLPTSLYYMNAEGRITDSYGFQDGGGPWVSDTGAYAGAGAFDLTVSRILEMDGRLYISITGMSQEKWQALHEWLKPIWSYFQASDGKAGVFADEFAARVRACYRAFLLVCDSETMEVLSVAAMDGAYATDEMDSFLPSISVAPTGVRGITWTVEAPYPTFYSPYTSSFTLAGFSYRYVYTLIDGENGGMAVGESKITNGNGYRK